MTRYSKWWIVLWATNVLILAVLLVLSVLPVVWVSAAVVLFFVPEFIGLRRNRDALPPLTQAIRRYVPRWIVEGTIFATAAWAVVAWWNRPHHVLITVIVAFLAGWGANHFDVTFDVAGE